MATVTFNELAQALADAGCETGAAECHAALTGLVCAGRPLQTDWTAQIAGREGNLAQCSEVLQLLLEEVAGDLAGENLEFDLALPDDDVPLAERVDALANWCRGFLLGLTLGGLESGQLPPGDIGEVVSDFARIAEAELDGDATDDENDDEQDFTELREFVRIAAQLVYEELAAQNKRP